MRFIIDDWHRVLKRAWSVRLSLLTAAIAGLYSIWPAFQGLLPLGWFALLAVVMSVLILVARLTKQPGFD